MKYLILLAFIVTISTTQAHPQYTMTPDVTVEHIKQYGWWAWIDEQQALAFCVGTDINNKPVCTVVPDDYVVIKYITKPKK